MKSKLLFTLLASAALFAGAGCNKSGKLNTPSEFKPPSGPVELKLKWPKGERVVQDMDLKQTTDINVPGRPTPMKQNVTMGQKYGLTVLSEDASGGHEVEMEFLSARMSSEMDGKVTFNYDSAKPSPKDKRNPVADVFNKIVGSKILFFMDASNNVERLEGMDTLVNKLTADRKDPSANSVSGMFNEGYFKQMMSANQFLPPKAVQPGDTWPAHMEFPLTGIGTMTLDYNITFKNWELRGKRNCARLEYDGNIKLKPDATPAPGAMTIVIPEGSTSGVSWFDTELGIVIDSLINEDTTMVITVPTGQRTRTAPAGGTMTMTNQMNQTISIKLDSVK